MRQCDFFMAYLFSVRVIQINLKINESDPLIFYAENREWTLFILILFRVADQKPTHAPALPDSQSRFFVVA